MKYDLIIGMCAYNTIKAETFQSFMFLRDEGMTEFTTYTYIWDALIGRSRSIVASRFLKKAESEVLLFVDSDIMFAPDHIYKILQAQRDGYDIVAGAYLRADGVLALRTLDSKPIDKLSVGKIEEVEYVSTGFFSISRKALEKIRDELELPLLHAGEEIECYPFFESGRDYSGKHKFYISEDWDFCEKARNTGYKIYWHTGVLVSHVKEMVLIPNTSFGILTDIPNQAIIKVTKDD